MTPAKTSHPAFFDDGLYTGVSHLTQHVPAVVNSAVSLWTDFGLGVFALLMIVGWWRARKARRPVLPVYAVPVVVVLSYVADDLLKSLVDEQRPCRILHVATVQACPPMGDWSFPSNHATIAAAATVALLMIDRRVGLLAVPVALLMAASRVWVGAHYPHDVLAGLAIGSVLAAVLTRLTLLAQSRLTPRQPVPSTSGARTP
ncbi:phosphatase PAP2 family protein [Streptomyces sp. NPDC059740]|uniref:phosphatase PAP2 family protein n=1 Tax=Streptomyces sp. NPDC059740 TaxID=3346926 RepID=UPI003658072F